MMNVLVTGSTGFIGSHLVRRLECIEGINLLTANSKTEKKDLKNWINISNVIYHLAATHKPDDDEEFSLVNYGLTKWIVENSVSNKSKIIFTSSIHAENKTAYGVSKKKSEDLLKDASANGMDIISVRLPYIFGPGGKPNYTSVVHTLCNSIANDLPFTINKISVELKLIYVDTLVDILLMALDSAVDEAYFQHELAKHEFKVNIGQMICILNKFRENGDVNDYLMSTSCLENLLCTFKSFKK